MIRELAIAAITVLGSTAALADVDSRIITLAYNPDQIVPIVGQPGIQSTIEFAGDERIENVAVGDSSAWQITPNHRASLLFLKPVVARSRTNMTVVTDRRTYMFDLVAGGKPAVALYALKFSYPKEKVEEPPKAAPHARILNFDWKMKGNGKLQPSRVFDDGSSLYLVWGRETPLPAILTVSEDRKEGPVDYSLDGDYIVVTPIPPNLMLRYGSRYSLIWPSQPKAPPKPAATPAASGKQAIALAQSSAPTATVPDRPQELTQQATAVGVPNMTTLYNDNLTGNQHER